MKNFNMGQRLIDLIKESSFSVEEVADQLGITKQSIYGLKNVPNPKTDTVGKILAVIKKPPNEYFSYMLEDVADWVEEPQTPYGYQDIPVLNAMAAAGIPREVDLTAAERYPVMRIHASILRPGSGYVALQVSGQSMMPVLNDGDWVIISRIHDLGELRAGRMYVIVTDAGAQVKMLESRTADTLHFQSKNADFGPFTPAVKDILQLWEVRMCWSHA